MVQLPALSVKPISLAEVFQGIDAMRANELNRQLVQAKIGQVKGAQERQSALAPLVGPAFSGDKEALGKLAPLDPDLAFKIEENFRKRSRAEQEKIARDGEIIARNVFNAKTPEEYFAGLKRAQEQGADISGAPEQYSPEVVQGIVASAMKLSDLVAQEQAKTPKFGKPIEAVDAQGNRVLVEFDQFGNARPVEGFSPAQKQDNQLVEVFDPNSPTGTRLVPRSEAAGQPGKPSGGLEITTDPRTGAVTVRTNARAGDQDGGLSKTSKTNVEKDLLKIQEGIARLENIDRTFKPEFQQIGLRFSQKFNAFREKAADTPLSVLLGDVSPQDKKVLAEFSAYKRDAIANLNRYIKEITGAQMSEAEAERLRRGMPDPGDGIFDGDSPTEFKAKLDSTLRALRAAAARKYYALRNGIDPFSLSLDGMESLIEKRGQEIEQELKSANPGISDAVLTQEIRVRLRDEFGI